MTYTVTITFDSDAPRERIEELAGRLEAQLEDLSDPDQVLVDADDPELPAYDYDHVKIAINGDSSERKN
jgi:hypothetical protein